jgi:hypothetical protein
LDINIPKVTVKTFLNNFSNIEINTIQELCDILNEMGNGLYNEFVVFLENSIKNAPTRWSLVDFGILKDLYRIMSKCISKMQYQSVWVDGNLNMLKRDVEWYSTYEECTKRGLENAIASFLPNHFMLIESCCVCYSSFDSFNNLLGEMKEPCKCLTSSNSNETGEIYDVDGFSRLHIDNVTIARAPWYTTSSASCGRTYNFTIQGQNKWFQSEKYNILEAYLEHYNL